MRERITVDVAHPDDDFGMDVKQVLDSLEDFLKEKRLYRVYSLGLGRVVTIRRDREVVHE